MKKQKFYITTAISYPNGEPHIGHAYEAIATDAIARYHRLDGKDVFFLTGTDEHGQKMVQTAEREGVTPLALADKNSARFKEMDKVLNISHDRFIRTTEPDHYKASQEIWNRMVAAGDIYLGGYEGWYSVRDEAYYADDEVTINAQGVRVGGQGTPVEWTKEETYFFRLSKYEQPLLDFYAANPNFVFPETRFNEVISFVKGGLRDLSISRTTFNWGVPVPNAPDHVMYVWVDALTNYLTGINYFEDGEKAEFWNSAHHVIGKDIIRFHAVYWIAFLMSAKIALPKRIFGHGFLLTKGEKMSKSLGNVVSPFDMARVYGVDQLRYFCLREVPFGQDGNYSHESMVNRTNADLANDLGNLAQRCLSFVAKNAGAVTPPCHVLMPQDEALLAQINGLYEAVQTQMVDVQLHRALEVIWAAVSETNRYFAAEAPWGLKKTDVARMETVLYVTMESLRVIAILTQPYIPEGAGKLLDLLAVEDKDFASLNKPLTSGVALPTPQGVFPRFYEATDAS